MGFFSKIFSNTSENSSDDLSQFNPMELITEDELAKGKVILKNDFKSDISSKEYN